MTISYLIKNRERPPLFSRRWITVWVKRAINMSGLIDVLTRKYYFQAKGSKVGVLTVLGKIEVNGPMRNISIGERSFVSKGVHLAPHGEIIIGNRVVINTSAQVLTASHRTDSSKWPSFSQKVIINDYAWIANNAIVLPGVTIGRGAVVGAGAVVSKDVAPYSIVVGNPAKEIRSRRPSDLDYSPVDLIACYEAWLGNPQKRN